MSVFNPTFRTELSPLARVIDALEEAGSTVRRLSNGNYSALCPAHDDRFPSLTIGEGENDKGLVHCFAGCSYTEILHAIGLKPTDLFPEQPKKRRQQKVAVYGYTDANGELLYQCVRLDPRGFFQRRPDGNGGWINNLGDVERVLYRLPQVIDAVALQETIWIVEGEKDVNALVATGVCATCNPMGAGKWRSEYATVLRNAAEVVIVADRDETGRNHAEDIAKTLRGRVGVLRIVEAATGKDAYDHLAAGFTLGDFREVSPQTPLAGSEPQPVLRLEHVQPTAVEWRWPGRLPKGKVVVLDGDPGLGKSTFTLDIAARISAGIAMPDGFEPDAPTGVLLCSAEDDAGDTIVPRLIAANADMSRCFLLQRVPVTQANGDVKYELPEFPTHCAYVEQVVRDYGVGLLVIDPLMAYLASETNSFQDQHVRRALLPLKELAERTGVTVIIVRHLNKSEGGTAIYRGGGSIGIVGASRAALIIGKNPDEPGHRVLAVAKINNAVTADSLGYHIVEHPEFRCSRIVWDGPTAHGADDLVRQRDADKDEDRSDAAQFLIDSIPVGEERNAGLLLKEAQDLDITPRMLRYAFKRLDGSRRKGDGGWWWTLPT